MLEWMHPAWFAALPLVLLPWLAWARPHAMRFSALSAVRAPRGMRWLFGLVGPLLESFTVLGVVLALARPQEVRRETSRESQGIDMLLAIDTSESMKLRDMRLGARELSRLQSAQVVMADFVSERPDDRLGLEVFGEEAFVQVPLTLDHDALTAFIEQLQIGMAGNRTAIGTAIAIGAKRMKELDAPSKVMILVTDGQSNAGSVRPVQAAEAAKALGIRVYTIGIGSETDVDEPTLTAIANTTGGRFYRATSASTLAKVYEEIDKLEKTTARSKEFVHRDERYLDVLLPAIASFVLQIVLGATVLRRIP